MWTSIGRFKSGIDTLSEPHSFANGLSEVFPRAVILTDGDRTPVTGAVDDGLEAWALCKGSAGVADLDISHALSERGNIQSNRVRDPYHPVIKDKSGRKKRSLELVKFPLML